MIDVSVIIVAWNVKKLLEDCLTSVFRETGGIKFEVIYVDNSQEATKKINESDRLDIIVVPAEYQHELLDSIIRFHPVAKVILVHDRRLNMEQESSYWIGDILTLLTWTNYHDFEQLMNQNPVR